MPTATMTGLPPAFRDPHEVIRHMQAVLDRGGAVAQSLRPRIELVPPREPGRGGADYVLRAGDDGTDGEKEVAVHITPAEFADPRAARRVFRDAYYALLGKVERSLMQKVYAESHPGGTDVPGGG